MLARVMDYHLSPARPFHGGVVEHPHPAPLGTDMHQAFEMGVLLSGSEERHFEDMVVQLDTGDMWLCCAWEPHGWRAKAGGTQELVLQFLPEFLGDEMFDGISWLSMFSAAPGDRPRSTSKEVQEQALAIAHEVRREMRDRRRGWLAAVRLGILRLLLMLSREWEPPELGNQGYAVRMSNMAKIMPAVRLVQSRPTRRLTLAEAAATCGLSVSQFGYVFRNVMGLSFGKFCMRARLAYVAQLLLGTSLSVEAIAQETGFADASHLHHAFVQTYGATPARYRTNGQRAPEAPGYTEIETLGPDDYESPSAEGAQT